MKNKKYLRIGTYTTAISLFAIAIVVIVNMLAGSVPTKYTKYDTSGKGYYDLTGETENLVASLDSEITIYLVSENGSEDAKISELLNRYKALNSKIKIGHIDPVLHPSFTTKSGQTHALSEFEANSLLVTSEKRDYVVNFSSIYKSDYTQEQLNYYYMMYGQVLENRTYFAGEGTITSALDFVSTDDLPVIYTLKGHGESEFNATLAGYLTTDNYETESLSLLTDKIPEDAACIVINNPTGDINEDELNALKSYIGNGGSVILLTSFNQDKISYKNLYALGEHFGIEAGEGLVCENTSGSYYQQQYIIIPTISSHTITQSFMSEIYVLMPVAHPLQIKTDLRDNVTVTPLLKTSSSAYITNGETLDPAEASSTGSYYVGVIASETKADDSNVTGNLVWYSSNAIIDESADSVVSGGNSKMFLSTLSNLTGKKESISIAAKSMDTEYLVVSEGAANIWSTVLTVIIPLLIIGIGLGIWLSRRKR